MSRSISLAVAALLLALAGAFLLLGRNPETGLVEDGAELMTREQRAFVAAYHDTLLRDHDIDYRVVTARGLGDINRAAVARFEDLAGTSRSRTGRGLLLVVDAEADLVRLEVGYALEGTFPDAFVAYVERRQMVPFFERARVADGILATTELIVARAQRAAESGFGGGFEGETWIAGSGGAGATAPARLGAGPQAAAREKAPAREEAAAVPAGRTPAETLAAYFTAMGARNADPGLDIYTPETRRMLEVWVMTPAQMDNLVKTYRRCHGEPARRGPDGRLAVIRYPPSERACAPWFFARVGGAWALDLTMMQRALRFNHSNYWRFDMSARHPYRFAFDDWAFDRHGFPKQP
jgi:uncharacterized protein